MAEGWTLEELVERVAHALAAVAVRAPNGRVTEVPDARVIRWYATIGVVDRPSGMRGRTALYGTRHLLQLVAVKRRQAEGRSLAEIQHELAGATDVTLRRLAGVAPARAATAGGDSAEEAAAGEAAIADAPADTASASTAGADAAIRLPPRPRASARNGGRRPAGRFWAQPPAAAAPDPDPERVSTVEKPARGAEAAPPERYAGGDDDAGLLYGVRLGGAVLLLPAAVGGEDLAAIRVAAQPLLELLARRGLAGPAGTIQDTMGGDPA
jgi:hypothetical protein